MIDNEIELKTFNGLDQANKGLLSLSCDEITTLFNTRKYPLRGYILGVLTLTTAWDRLWGGDETLKGGFEIVYT